MIGMNTSRGTSIYSILSSVHTHLEPVTRLSTQRPPTTTSKPSPCLRPRPNFQKTLKTGGPELPQKLKGGLIPPALRSAISGNISSYFPLCHTQNTIIAPVNTCPTALYLNSLPPFHQTTAPSAHLARASTDANVLRALSRPWCWRRRMVRP